MNAVFFIVCMVLCAWIAPGRALTCYECSSHTDDSCHDEYSGKESHETSGCDVCVKAKLVEYDESEMPGGFTLRACGKGNGADKQATECTEKIEGGNNKYEYCYCKEDKCNTGTVFFITEGALLSVLAIKWLL